jgi:hypothetical protein
MQAGRVISVDQVSDKDGASAWQVVTDYGVKDADGRTRCAIWLPRPGPFPSVGMEVGWGHSLARGAYAMWAGERHKRLGFAFDPNDPALYTG